MKPSIGEILVTIVFISVIVIFGFLHFAIEDKEASEFENRKLEQRPDATVSNIVSGEYPKRFETYYNDQFPLRSLWIEGKNSFEKTIFRKDVVDSVYVHDDGYLIPLLQTTSDTLEPKVIAKRIDTFYKNLSNHDINVYFALAPNKTTMMEDKMPSYVFSEANQLTDQLIKELSKNINITALDLRDAIGPHMNEDNMYFFTDHHWKPKAAYYAYNHIVKEMGLGLTPIPMEAFSWEESEVPFLGSDARRTTESYVKQSDTLTIVSPRFDEEIEICYRGNCDQSFYDLSHLDNPDKYTNRYKIYFSGDVPEGIIRNSNVSNNRKLLILKDSYANPLIQFISRNFAETRIIDMRHFEKDIFQYIKEHGFTDVLFVHNINSLVTTPTLTNFN